MQNRLRLRIAAIIFALGFSNSCGAQSNYVLCPDLADIGKGSREYEDAKRCVRVMAARYSVSNQSPDDVATAAIDFCRDYKFGPLTQGEQLQLADQILDQMIADFRAKAIRTVVEMRTGDCLAKPGLFDHIDDPIDRPSVGRAPK